MAADRDLTYINKDFSDLRSQLINYAKNYFPESYNDFSESSPGMMFIEMASYVGDILSFYQDTQLQETFLTHAKDKKNLFNLAYMMGYTPKLSGAAEVELEVTQLVGAIQSGSTYIPNWSQAAFIEANSTIRSTDNSKTKFLTTSPVDFKFSSSYDPTEVTINNLDVGNPSEFLLKKKVRAYSGEIKEIDFTIDTVDKFKTLTITDSNIIGINTVTGSNDVWTEVPFLGQDTVYIDEQNISSDSNNVPYVLKLKKAPKRFVSRFKSNGSLDVQFGAGTTGTDDTEFLPDPSKVKLGTGGVSKLGTSYDPSNFLYSNSYGVSPSDDIHIEYIVGGGVKSNVPANTLTEKFNINLSNGTLDSISFTNPKPASGGRDGDTEEELRENSLRAFNEQGRVVTLQDYTIRALSLPSKYGSIAKAFATQDQLTNSNLDKTSPQSSNSLALSLYTLAYDANKNLINSPASLKENLKTYMSQFMIVTDSLVIKDAFIVNIGINYEVIVRPDYAGRDVLLDCNLKIQDYFNINKMGINQPINITNLYRELDKIKGVQTVQKIEVENKSSGNYSQYGYDIKGATRNNIVYPSFDPCIFEVKFPEQDIKGRITTL